MNANERESLNALFEEAYQSAPRHCRILDDLLLVELKCVNALAQEHLAQRLNYPKASTPWPCYSTSSTRQWYGNE